MSSSSETYKVRNERETQMTNETKTHFTLEQTRASIRRLLENEFALVQLTEEINNNKSSYVLIEADKRFMMLEDDSVVCW